MKKNKAFGYCLSHYRKFKKYGDVSVVVNKHGEQRKKNPLYKLYTNIKTRCYNKNSNLYKHYGGRGIVVCDRRLGPNGFSNFYKDMRPRPEGYSIDRIDNNGNYEPGNCRRATKREQARNKRNNNRIIGTSYIKRDKLRVAYVNENGKRKTIGYGKTEQDVENIHINYRKLLEYESKQLDSGEVDLESSQV